MLGWLHKMVGGRPWERELTRVAPYVEEINTLGPDLKKLSDEDLRAQTDELRHEVANGASLDDVLPEAFALVREGSRRTIGMSHYDVQLIGGAILHGGRIAEMRTGEGKTLVATLPTYLNALTGKGVHVVTVNDYLARRDAQWMGAVYHALGMSVGVIQHDTAFLYDPTYQAEEASMAGLRPVAHRREAYAADITYGTNNEFGFDYLRDNMVWQQEDMVQRELHYAIVDEVDNILVDEARTPLIISGPADDASADCQYFAKIVRLMREDVDFTIEQRTRSIALTDEGIEKVERMLGVQNLYAPENVENTYYLENAMKAEFLFHRDNQYVVRDREVIIVDEFTGRMMPGRRYSEGLHQAIEAKEGVPVQRENVTWARITFQNYFRLYEKLAGMTGTALTEADEFRRIYNLDVVPIPTHKQMVRADLTDLVYKTENGKFAAVVSEIEELAAKQRPVLVGTVSIDKSEHLSRLLRARGIKHEVLNAKNHEREAAIIAQAGRLGAVTIATNMAGRGVDILLGGNPAGLADDLLKDRRIDRRKATPEQLAEALREAEERCAHDRVEVVNLGGLHVLGTERHEARRIDNQLRGRSGRQGDPGSSRFYLSLEDDLMKRFGGSRIAGLMGKLGLEETVPLEHSWVNKAVASAQGKVEALNFDMRKHVVEYDDVMNLQREVIYADRRKALADWSMGRKIDEWVGNELPPLVLKHLAGDDATAWDYPGLRAAIARIDWLANAVDEARLAPRSRQEVHDYLADTALEVAPSTARQIEQWIAEELEPLVDEFLTDEESNAWDQEGLTEALARIPWLSDSVDAESLATRSRQDMIDYLAEAARDLTSRLRRQSEQWIDEELDRLLDTHLPPEDEAAWDYAGLRAAVEDVPWLRESVDASRLQPRSRQEIINYLAAIAREHKPSARQRIGKWLEEEVSVLIGEHLAGDDPNRWDYEAVLTSLRRIPRLGEWVALDDLRGLTRPELIETVGRVAQQVARDFPSRIHADLRRLMDMYLPSDEPRSGDHGGLLRALPHIPGLLDRVVMDQLRAWPRQRIFDYLRQSARQIASEAGLEIVEWVDKQPEMLAARYLRGEDPESWDFDGLERALENVPWVDEQTVQEIESASSQADVIGTLTGAANEHSRWLRETIEGWVDQELPALVDTHLPGDNPRDWRVNELLQDLEEVDWLEGAYEANTVRLGARDAVGEYLLRKALEAQPGLKPADQATIRAWANRFLQAPNPRDWQLRALIVEIRRVPGLEGLIAIDQLRAMTRDEVVEYLSESARDIMARESQSVERWVQRSLARQASDSLGGEDPDRWNLEGLLPALKERPLLIETLAASQLERLVHEDERHHRGRDAQAALRTSLIGYLVDAAGRTYDRWAEALPPEILRTLEQQWVLPTIDRHWIRHLTAIDDLREGIGLRAYGQRDPLVEYKVEAAAMFDDLLARIRHDVVYAISAVNFEIQTEPRGSRRAQPTTSGAQAPTARPQRGTAAERRPPPTTTNRNGEGGKQPVKVGKKPGRNDKCHCGSGKKYKVCHGPSEGA